MNSFNFSEISEIFPTSTSSINTRGIAVGIVVKFQEYYLKIYDADVDSYKVMGFKYGAQLPVFEKVLKWNEFQEFSKVFIRKNTLAKCATMPTLEDLLNKFPTPDTHERL